jgi:hypothetical protein
MIFEAAAAAAREAPHSLNARPFPVILERSEAGSASLCAGDRQGEESLQKDLGLGF